MSAAIWPGTAAYSLSLLGFYQTGSRSIGQFMNSVPSQLCQCCLNASRSTVKHGAADGWNAGFANGFAIWRERYFFNSWLHS